MGEENKVILHGASKSLFTKRVELALKLKGITYEYLEYNPDHKKILVLVHNGKPIAESPVIIKYINEMWKHNSRLLHQDLYRRAQVRFSANYIHQTLFETMSMVIKTKGETQEKAIEEVMENLKVLEDGMKDNFLPNGIPTLNNENVGLVDIVMCSLFSPHEAQEEVLGVVVIDLEKTPLIFFSVKALKELPAVKQILPPHKKLVALAQFIRKKFLQPATA